MPSCAGGGVVGVEGLGVGDALVADPAAVLPVAVLGADAGVVEPGGDRVDVLGLAVVVLEDVAEAAVEDAGPALASGSTACSPAVGPAAARLGADQLDLGVVDERIEHPRGVRAAADAGDDGVGQAAEPVEALLRGSRGR